MPAEDRLEDLLLVWEELKEQGQQPSVEELCRNCPELVDTLRQAIAALERMAWLDDGLAAADRPFRAGSAAASGPWYDPSRAEAVVQRSPDEEPHEGPSAPLVLGDYTVLQPIGVGGMGRVYKAIHRHMERVVALKVVREDAVASPDAIARFHREMKAAARLEHPNIVTAHDAGEDRGICYLVMEFVDGCDLARHVREQGPMPVEQAVDCVIQAARGLGYAHEQGIIHRDVKPANLLLAGTGTVKVLDLGLARFREGSAPATASLPADACASETYAAASLRDAVSGHGVAGLREQTLTQTGAVHGTVAYMAPEQREDSKGADHRADIYSLGCTLYFLLTGCPLPDRGADAAGTSTGHEGVAASLSRQRPEVLSVLAAVLEKMTAPRPEDRYPSMGQVMESLQAAQDSGSNAARRRARRRLMKALLAVIAAGVLSLAGWAAYETYGDGRAAALQQRLLDAPTTGVPGIIAQLAPYRRWADPRLKAAYDDARARHDTRRQLHASLGLLPVDSRQVDYLVQRLLNAEAADFPIIRDALSEHRNELIERLWAVWGSTDQTLPQRLRVACALATYAPRDSRWSLTTSGEVAMILVAEPAGALEHWTECFRPVRDHLEAHLLVNFRLLSRDQGEQRVAAARILASWFVDQPQRLVDLLMEADPAQFAVLSPAVQVHRLAAVSLLDKELDRPVPSEKESQETWAKRQAAARAVLLRFGQTKQVWPALTHKPDPTVRSYLIHRLGPSGADPELLANRLQAEKEVSVRRALILALGGFPEDGLSRPLHDSLIRDLGALYRDDPDPGIHGAAEWLLRKWGQDAKLQEIDPSAKSGGQPGWYVNGQGQTMVAVPSPVQFMMGSPASEPGVQPDEALQPMSITRAFAIGAKEVTVEEFGRFLAENPEVPRPEADRGITGPDHPQTHVTWPAAVAYCRWLSRKEGIPEDELCYPPVSATADHLQLPADFLDRQGYRLATEAEWEYACRAGSRTSRFYGDPDDLLDEYARNSRVSMPAGTRPVGLLKPNDFGLFDVYGNVMEWCHHAADDDWPDAAGMPRRKAITAYPAERFRLRGASHRNRLEEARSARRFQYKAGRMTTYLGFRLAQTLPTRSLAVVPRGQPLWGDAEFLVQGPKAPFVIKQVQGGVEVSPASGTTPAWVRVTAPDGRTRRFSCVVEQTDAQETVTVRGLLFSSEWDMEFYTWDQANRDELNRPADWGKLVVGPPLAERKSTHLDFDWGLRAPARNAPRDHFALVATTKLELPAGRYELWAMADNGVRVFVDDIQRIDFNVWLPDQSTSSLAELQLESGEHSLRVEYYESRDHARVRVGLRPLE